MALKGVYPNGKKWKAVLCIKGKRMYLGTFDTPEDASREYWVQKAKHRNEIGVRPKRDSQFYVERMEKELGL